MEYGADHQAALEAGAELVDGGTPIVQCMRSGELIVAAINGEIIKVETIEQAARIANVKNAIVTEYECE